MGLITLIKNASFVIGYENDSHCIYKEGEVAYKDDRIIYVGKKYTGKADSVIDAKQGIVSPGLIDLHVDLRSLQLEKSMIEDIGNPFHFMDDYYDMPDPDTVTEEEQLELTRFSMAELMSKGVTCVYAKGNADEEVLKIIGESGIRSVYAPMAADSRIIKEDSRELNYEKLSEVYGKDILEKTMSFREKYEGAYEGRLSVALGFESSDTCSEELLKEAAELMKKDDTLLLSIGAAQTVDEFIEIAYRYGVTPAEYLHRCGIYGPRVQYVNYVMRSGHHMNTMILENELSRIAEDKTTVINCPWKYGRRGIVMESFQKYHDAGITMGIGTDSSSLDMMLEMRFAAILCKYAEDVNPLKGKADIIYNAATVDAAKSIGREDVGKLKEGCKADIMIVDVKNLDCSPMRDPIKSIVFTAMGKNVSHVIVDGKTMVENKKLVGLEREELIASVQNISDKYGSSIPMTFPVR